jgi:hypothetical protein
MGDSKRYPLQPIGIDDYGTVRFRANGIVRFLLDAGPFDMNQIAVLPGITNEEREQFAQLIGYSVSGFNELSYVSDEACDEANRAAEAALEERDVTCETRHCPHWTWGAECSCPEVAALRARLVKAEACARRAYRATLRRDFSYKAACRQVRIELHRYEAAAREGDTCD